MSRWMPRISEWLVFRQTGKLDDIIDEAEFMRICGVSQNTVRKWMSRRPTVHGLIVPQPIFRADGMRNVWLRREVEDFARKYRAASKGTLTPYERASKKRHP